MHKMDSGRWSVIGIVSWGKLHNYCITIVILIHLNDLYKQELMVNVLLKVNQESIQEFLPTLNGYTVK